jgi:ABC-2 type transport system permease protein
MTFANHALIEARKLAGTRSGKGLIAVLAVLAICGALVSMSMPADTPTLSIVDTYAMAVAPLVLFVPITAMVTLTSEWSTRSAVLTFTLTPQRGGVLAGKVLLGAALSVVAPLYALGLAVIATEISALSRGRDVSYANAFGFNGGLLQNVVLVTTYTAFAIAVGMLVRVTAAAVPVFLALTVLPDAVLKMVLGSSANWVSPIRGFEKLSSGDFSTGVEFGQAGTVIFLWLLLPLILGGYRFLRTDIG